MVSVLREQEVLQEAEEILLEHLSPAKVARFWAALQAGAGDYLAIRERLFADETVETLFTQAQEYEQNAQ